MTELKEIKDLTIDEILEILPHCDEIIAWAKSIKDYCLYQIQQGTTLKGWMVVNGKSKRKWLAEKKVKTILLNQGLKDTDIYERKLLSPAKIEKIVGKEFYQEHLEGLVEKPEGTPTLVPDYDNIEEFKQRELKNIFKGENK